MIALLALVFFVPDRVWGLCIAALVWFASGEWARLIGAKTVGRHIFGALVAIPVVAWSFAKPDPILLGAAYAAALALWVFSVPVFLRFQIRLEGVYARFGYGLLIFVPAALSMIELRRAGSWLLLAFMAPVWIADVAAFFVGRKWGRVKLAPTISPGKSREGVAGAVVAVAIYAAVLHTFSPQFASRAGLLVMLGFSLAFTVLSVGGDLFESLLKRQAGVKDSGDLLPGHGGILDRVDSLLSTLPLAGLLWMIYQ